MPVPALGPPGRIGPVERLVDRQQNPQAMIDAPRWRVEAGPTIHIEEAMPAESIEALRRMGHTIVVAANAGGTGRTSSSVVPSRCSSASWPWR